MSRLLPLNYVHRPSTFLLHGDGKFHLFFLEEGKKIHINQFSFAKKNGSGRMKLWSDEFIEEIRKGIEPMTFPQRE